MLPGLLGYTNTSVCFPLCLSDISWPQRGADLTSVLCSIPKNILHLTYLFQTVWTAVSINLKLGTVSQYAFLGEISYFICVSVSVKLKIIWLV